MVYKDWCRKKETKYSSVLLLRLVSFFLHPSLVVCERMSYEESKIFFTFADIPHRSWCYYLSSTYVCRYFTKTQGFYSKILKFLTWLNMVGQSIKGTQISFVLTSVNFINAHYNFCCFDIMTLMIYRHPSLLDKTDNFNP